MKNLPCVFFIARDGMLRLRGCNGSVMGAGCTRTASWYSHKSRRQFKRQSAWTDEPCGRGKGGVAVGLIQRMNIKAIAADDAALIEKVRSSKTAAKI